MPCQMESSMDISTKQDASLSEDEDLNISASPGPSKPANPVHMTLIADGFLQEIGFGTCNTASRVWKERFFTMWVKTNPAGGKPLRYAVCECSPGRCKE